MVTDVFIGILARHLRRYVMGAFIIVDISMEYWHILLFIYSYVAINCITKCMFQRRRCCAFSAQFAINFGIKKRQSWYKKNVSTPSVLRFLSVIRHESPHYSHVFSKKAQHLWRWISLWTFTRGRLVPRQPRAIKNTTRTELHGKIIVRATWLRIKGEMVCVISSCKTRQNARPFDADECMKWWYLECHFSSTLKALYFW